jgi:hypothetical protein
MDSYGLNSHIMAITCESFGRIMDIVIGWPGSVHENRVWMNSSICLNPEDYFMPREFLIGNSAFKFSKKHDSVLQETSTW